MCIRDRLTGDTHDSTTPTLIKGMNTTRGLQPFMRIKGTGIPAGTYIVSVDSATQITISQAATAVGNDVALTVGQFDHALFLEMEYFKKKLNGTLDDVDLSEDGSGTQGYVKGFYSNFCGLGTPQARVYSN